MRVISRTKVAPLTPRAVALRFLFLLLACDGAGMAFAQAPSVAGPVADPVAVAIGKLLESDKHPTMRWSRISDVSADLRRLYEPVSDAPLWFAGGTPTPAARALVAELQGAEEVGLSPADYDAPKLASSLDLYGPSVKPPSATARARLDVALSANALRYVAAIGRGRVSPEAAGATLFIPREPFDARAVVDSIRLAGSAEEVHALVERVHPPHRHYATLVEALARYRRIGRDTTLVPLPSLPKKLSPGDRYAGAERLRRLLTALRDLPDVPAPPQAADTLYDSTLVAGVRSFQFRQGMKPDGVIGGRTAARLNRPFADRVRSIELTLERWRWLPRHFAAPPVLVNIPAFRLYAFAGPSDDERDMLAMDVVVGRAYDTETPVFSETMKYLVFSPYWEVPTSIATGEIRPAASRDASYLASRHYQLLRGGAVVAPSADNIAAIGKSVRVRQLSGDDNSLGRVKFMMPNRYDVYLHDTPSKGRFEEERRDLSHGCIRVSQPAALAAWALSDDKTWTKERIDSAMQRTEPQQVQLARPRPVFVLYGTATSREDGLVLFYEDLYDLDEKLDGLLRHGYPYPS